MGGFKSMNQYLRSNGNNFSYSVYVNGIRNDTGTWNAWLIQRMGCVENLAGFR
jgi:hypothetical protein